MYSCCISQKQHQNSAGPWDIRKYRATLTSTTPRLQARSERSRSTRVMYIPGNTSHNISRRLSHRSYRKQLNTRNLADRRHTYTG